MAERKFTQPKKKKGKADPNGLSADAQAVKEKTAKLRALRLAKEEADRAAAAQAAAEKALVGRAIRSK